MGAVSYYTKTQKMGDYRCKSITITFGNGKEGGPTAPDEFWGGAYVNGQEKLLMYSHFNGVYVEDGECLCQLCTCAWHSIIIHCSLIHTNISTASTNKGFVNGFPRFVEQNKVDGQPFQEVIPAEVIYCSDIGSWVFWHPNIKTSPPNKPEYEVSETTFTCT